jgi:hypothetical protein
MHELGFRTVFTTYSAIGVQTQEGQPDQQDSFHFPLYVGGSIGAQPEPSKGHTAMEFRVWGILLSSKGSLEPSSWLCKCY